MSTAEEGTLANSGERRRTVTPVGLIDEAHGEARGRTLTGGYGRRDFWRRRLLAGADVAGILLALAGATLVGDRSSLGQHLLLGALTLPAWIVLFKLYGLYDRDAKRVSHTTVDDIPWIFHALVVGGLSMWFYFKLVAPEPLVLSESVAFGCVAFAGMLSLRSLVRSASATVLSPERVLLVGEGALTRVLVRKMRAHPEYGMDPVGVIAASDHAASEASGLPVLGNLEDLAAVVSDHRIDRIVLSHTSHGEETQLELLRACRELSLKVGLLPEPFDAMGPGVEVDDVEGVTLLAMTPPVLSRSSRFLKRGMDLVVSSLLLSLTAPAMALIALAIKLDSKGPFFFLQYRVVKDGRRFRLLKFRTMAHDAEQRAEELRHLSKDPDWLHLDHDPRVTRVGRFLRTTSLDELPELFNVLKGEMSLVGPRPLIESEDRRIAGWARSRLHLTPGVTGLWQVLGRTNIPFEEMIKLDYLYVMNWSLWNDVRLMLRTLPVVVRRRGAN